jgi:hypothetical protein
MQPYRVISIKYAGAPPKCWAPLGPHNVLIFNTGVAHILNVSASVATKRGVLRLVADVPAGFHAMVFSGSVCRTPSRLTAYFTLPSDPSGQRHWSVTFCEETEQWNDALEVLGHVPQRTRTAEDLVVEGPIRLHPATPATGLRLTRSCESSSITSTLRLPCVTFPCSWAQHGPYVTVMSRCGGGTHRVKERWSRQRHLEFPKDQQDVALTVMLCAQRISTLSPADSVPLPVEMWLAILAMLDLWIF